MTSTCPRRERNTWASRSSRRHWTARRHDHRRDEPHRTGLLLPHRHPQRRLLVEDLADDEVVIDDGPGVVAIERVVGKSLIVIQWLEHRQRLASKPSDHEPVRTHETLAVGREPRGRRRLATLRRGVLCEDATGENVPGPHVPETV